jgi:hypothetical protein
MYFCKKFTKCPINFNRNRNSKTKAVKRNSSHINDIELIVSSKRSRIAQTEPAPQKFNFMH